MGVAGDARVRVAPRPQAETGPWRHVWGRRLLPYALIAPAFILILRVLGYPLGMLLRHLGLGNYIHHNCFENPIQGFTVITVIVVWGAIPFLALMIYAGLTQVPRELVEAAEIDGARPWQVFARITVPILRPVFLVVISLSTIWDFGVFNQVWVLLNQRPSQDYFLMSVYSFPESFRVSQFGLGSPAAAITTAILVVVTFAYVRQTLRLTEEAE